MGFAILSAASSFAKPSFFSASGTDLSALSAAISFLICSGGSVNFLVCGSMPDKIIVIRRLQLHNFGCGMTATPVHATIIHTGGTRAYVAEGAEIVIPGQARPFVEKMIQAEHKLAPDALARQPKPAKIVDVKDTMSLKDETVEINLYNIPNPHS